MGAPVVFDRDGKCPNCARGVKVGDRIVKWEKGHRRDGSSVNIPRHDCSDPKWKAPGSGLPSTPDTTSDTPKDSKTPIPGGSEAPIYTYHRTYHGDTKTWEIMVGVSVMGRPLMPIEMAQVDDLARPVEWRHGAPGAGKV